MNVPTKNFNSQSNQFKHSPLQHVHFLWVHHTWLDFSGHNPEGVRKEYQDLCGTQFFLVHKWKFLRFKAFLDTCSDTMFDLMKHMIFWPAGINFEKKVAEERNTKFEPKEEFVTPDEVSSSKKDKH